MGVQSGLTASDMSVTRLQREARLLPLARKDVTKNGCLADDAR